jgi:predicted alpha-1,2-mannosidase
MKFQNTFIFIFLFITVPLIHSQTTGEYKNPNRYVNPFIGTGGHGHTFPGATVPFGMVQLSPDNGTSGWDWCSGYNYADSIIVGFSHTHLSGTGIGDLCDISFMPAVIQIDSNEDSAVKDLSKLQSSFSHDEETAVPGYYEVMLKTFNIKAELTATKRAGFQQYTFPHTKNAIIAVNLGFHINWDSTTAAYIKVINNQTIVGYRMSTGWAKDQRVYFAAKFSQPFKTVLFENDNQIFKNEIEKKGNSLKGVFEFNTEKNNKILAKVGISSANIDGAMKDLDTEIAGWNFDKIKNEASKNWEQQLSKIKVKSADKQLKEIFYTALYHAMLAPNLFSDANGNYKGADSLVHQAKGYNQYTVFSLWDTFRAEHPLLTIIEQDKVSDFVNSMLAHYKQTGLLPVWELEGNETNTMIGYHAVPIIADAILKGFKGFSVKEAYKAMKTSAMADHFGLKYYKELGYIPADKENQSVSKTIEYAYDDWCIAQVAKSLHKEEDYKYFMKRAGNYKNQFDKSTGFMRGKNLDGSWLTPFDPQYSNFEINPYTEGNAWQWSWFVPQDVQGLINLMGGPAKFVTKLDSLFIISSTIKGKNVPPDISGLIGQYAQGDEPSHHIAYLYDYAGEPWKTQEIVRKICETLYTDNPKGLCGNDDCGQMSAWYVFSSIGFYPVNPAEGIYIIGSPMFDKVTINVGNSKKFTVIANNVSKKNKYIQSAELNGHNLNRTYIYHKEIMNGGELIFNMGDKPNKNWGSEPKDFPPSMSNQN